MRLGFRATLKRTVLVTILASVIFSSLATALLAPQKAHAQAHFDNFHYEYNFHDGRITIRAYNGDDCGGGGPDGPSAIEFLSLDVGKHFGPSSFDKDCIDRNGGPINGLDNQPINNLNEFPNIAIGTTTNNGTMSGGTMNIPNIGIHIDHDERLIAYQKCYEQEHAVVSLGCIEKEAKNVLDQRTAPPNTQQDCEDKAPVIGWILCDLILKVADGVLNTLDTNIRALLDIDSQYYSNADFKKAWGTIRNLAYLILVPVTLVMVIATALGFDFISAYTVRRALPRLVLVVIGIALSYQLCVFLIDFFNAVGHGTFGLITAPFPGARDLTLSGLLGESTLSALLTSIAIVALVAIFFVPIIVAVLIGFFVLVLRQMLIVGLILLSPVALLGWIFPANQKLWNLWWGTFTRLLVMFPMIEGLIALGRVFAWLIHPQARAWAPLLRPAALFGLLGWHGFAQLDQTFLGSSVGAGLVLVIPYGLIPLTYAAAGSALGFAAGKMSEVGGKAQNYYNGLRSIRRDKKFKDKQTRKQRRQTNAIGQNTRLDALGEKRGPVGWAAGRAAAARRRRAMRQQGHISRLDLLTPTGREGVRAEEEKLSEAAVDEAIKQDNIGIGGDDVLTGLFRDRKKLSGRQIDREYAAKRGVSIRDARRKRRQFEKQMDVRAGTFKGQLAGAKAWLASSTNTDTGKGDDRFSEEKRVKMMQDVADTVMPFIESGHRDANWGAGIMALASRRAEISGADWLDRRKFLEDVHANGGEVTPDMVSELHSSAIHHLQSGQAMGSDYRTAASLFPQFITDINKELETHRTATNQDDRDAALVRAKELAGKLRGYHSVVQSVDPTTANNFIEGTLDRTVETPGGNMPVWNWIDELEAAQDDHFNKAYASLYPKGANRTPTVTTTDGGRRDDYGTL